jgi:hypothetical protein
MAHGGGGVTRQVLLNGTGQARYSSNEAGLGAVCYLASWVPPTADYDVTVVFKAGALGQNGPCGRFSGTNIDGDPTGYWLRYNTSNSLYELYQVVANSYTLLGTSGSAAPVDGTTLTLRMIGTQISGLKNGATIIGPFTGSVSAKSQAGIVMVGNSSITASTGLQLDAISTLVFAAGTVSPTVASPTSVLVTGTVATGGVAPYSYQFRRSADGATGWANVGTAQSDPTVGVTDSGLTAGSTWYYDYVATDSASQTSTSAAVPVLLRPGQAYYISLAGNDANDGLSPGAPWLTIAKVNAQKVTAGDSFNFRGGDTFSGNLVLALATGAAPPTAIKPAVVTSYGVGDATLSAGDNHGIWSQSIPNCQIFSINILGSSITVTPGSPNVLNFTTVGTGILVSNVGTSQLPGLVIHQVNITGFNYGIMIGDHDTVYTNGYDGAQVTLNVIHEIVQVGFTVYNANDFSHPTLHSDLYAAGNHIYNCYGSWNGGRLGIDPGGKGTNSGYPMIVMNMVRGVVENNALHDGGLTGTTEHIGGPTGLMLVNCNATIARANEIWNQHTQNTQDATGIDLDGGCSNCIIDANYVHDCDGAAFETGTSVGPTTNNTFRFNVTQGNGKLYNFGGLFNFLSAAGNIWHNNTFYHSRVGSGPVELIGAVGSSLNKWYNNVFIVRNGATFGDFTGTDVMTGNLYDAGGGSTFSVIYNGTTYTSLAAMHAAGLEMGGGAPSGIQAAAGLRNVGGAPSGGTLPGNPVSVIADYDPTGVGSNVLNSGLNLSTLYGLNIGTLEFHRLQIAGNNIGATDLPAAAFVGDDDSFPGYVEG